MEVRPRDRRHRHHVHCHRRSHRHRTMLILVVMTIVISQIYKSNTHTEIKYMDFTAYASAVFQRRHLSRIGRYIKAIVIVVVMFIVIVIIDGDT